MSKTYSREEVIEKFVDPLLEALMDGSKQRADRLGTDNFHLRERIKDLEEDLDNANREREEEIRRRIQWQKYSELQSVKINNILDLIRKYRGDDRIVIESPTIMAIEKEARRG